MSRIGPSQTVLPNRISCLCVESIRRIRRTPVFGVRGAASARSALSFRCKQVCLDSFFTRNTLVAGFFCPFFPPSPPVQAAPPRLVTLSHSTHFGSAQNLRIFTYKTLPMPNVPEDGENPKKRLDFRCFLPKKTHETMTKVKLHGRVYTYSAHFSTARARLRPGISP